MHGGNSSVVELVTTNSDVHARDFLFVRTDGGDEAAICDFAAA